MNIIEFINSKAIREHMAKFGDIFSPFDKSYLIYQARKKSVQEKISAMNELLEKGEYAEFYNYYDRFNIRYDQFREYNSIAYLSSYYSTVCKYLSDYLFAKESYSDPLLRLCTAMKDYVDDYKSVIKREDNDFTIRYINDLHDQFTNLIKNCLNYTDEDIAKIGDLSSSELVILTTERMNHEEEQ